MKFLIIGLLYFLSISRCSGEENEWVWKDNKRSSKGRNGGLRYEESRGPRYDVYENGNENYNEPVRPLGFNNRPIYSGPEFNRPPPVRPSLINNRPLLSRPEIINNRPIYTNTEFPENSRPGNYDNIGPINNGYGQGGRPFNRPQYHPNDPRDPGILTGPIPSWVQEKPFKNFDTCKCTEGFNCRSPGLSYGHCDVGKKYCCYNRNKIEELVSDFPSRPVHSPENGILVGPGGPSGVSQGFGRPGFLGNRPPNYGVENGILTGPIGRADGRIRTN